MKYTFVGVLLFILVGYASAAEMTIDAVPAQSLGLGTSRTVPITLHGEGAADLSIDQTALTQDSEHDVVLTIAPKHVTFSGGSAQATVTITTKTSAPSFTGGKFAVAARSADSSVAADIGLSIEAVYTVTIIKKRDGHCADNTKVTDHTSWVCDFDSAPDTAYFRAHAAGLKLVFINKTDDTLEIHGSDAVQHGMQAFGPGQTDPLARVIAPTPADLKGSYTLHEIYRPGRDVVFNASRIH
jgi:hypothetical protein